MVFCSKSASNQAYCRGFLEKDTFGSDSDAKFGKMFSYLKFMLHKNLLKIFGCSKTDQKLPIMKIELSILATITKNC